MELALLCFKVFSARILDVTIGTVRTVFVVKEKRFIAASLAFIEALIWFTVVKEALNTTNNSIFIPIAYAAGFASGTFLGTFINSTYIRGHLTLNVISSKIKEKDILYLKSLGYGVSAISMDNEKKMLVIEINKKRLKELENELLSLDKNAFIIINDTKVVHNGFIK